VNLSPGIQKFCRKRSTVINIKLLSYFVIYPITYYLAACCWRRWNVVMVVGQTVNKPLFSIKKMRF